MKKLTKEKRKLLINGILLITSVILIMGTSYAWLTLTLTATKTNVIKVGTLLLNLYDQTSIAIDQDKAVPVYDE